MNNIDSLPLPNLSISGFRGLKELKIPRLGQVTLLTGKNGVGKTTVLEAAKLWATRGSSRSIIDLLSDRGEIVVNVDGQIEQRNATFIFDLFSGREPVKNDQFTLGPYNEKGNRELRFRLESKNVQLFVVHNTDRRTTFTNVVAVEREFAGRKATINWTPNPIEWESKDKKNKISASLPCDYLGPAGLARKVVVEFRDNVALTEGGDLVINALNSALNLRIRKIATVGEGSSLGLLAKVEGIRSPVPLASLGEGVTRVFSIVLNLVSCKNGLLLIDDVGNGIHHTIQQELWDLICQTARDYNVQVIATTHSFDCVRGFARATIENRAVEGVLVRVEQNDGAFKVVTFDESEVEVVARKNIEVR